MLTEYQYLESMYLLNYLPTFLTQHAQVNKYRAWYRVIGIEFIVRYRIPGPISRLFTY